MDGHRAERPRGERIGGREARTACVVGLAACLALAVLARVAAGEQVGGERPGAEELFHQGVEAFKTEQYADAAALFRLSYRMKQRPAAQCNLGLTYERWGGHHAEAVAAYRRCAAEDDTGRFRDMALDKARALEAPAGEGGSEPARSTSLEAVPWPRRVTIAWGDVAATPRCVFWSGPVPLGQADQLGQGGDILVTGEAVSLAFDGGVIFGGRLTGRLVTLGRRSTRVRGGARWVVEESITGILEGDVLVGEYHNQRCDEAHRAECPGTCAVHAKVRVTVEREQ